MKSFTICLVVKYYFLCLGSSLLVKPITEQGSVGTSVYFPGKDEVSFRINTDCFSNACTSWLIGNSYPYTCIYDTCINIHVLSLVYWKTLYKVFVKDNPYYSRSNLSTCVIDFGGRSWMVLWTCKWFGLIITLMHTCLVYRCGTTLTRTRVTLDHRTPTLTPL